MKKQLIAMAMLSMTIGAMADELRVADVVLPQNSTAAIEIELLNPNTVYESFSFQLELPNGVIPVMTAQGYPDFTQGTRFSNVPTSNYISDSNIASFARLTDGNTITGASGMLIAPIVKVNGDVAVGTVLTATLSNIIFTKPDLTKDTFEPVSFSITIGEPVDGRTLLDETSTTAPEAATGVDVRVRRTINANEWSTICLPFAMTEAQVKAAFGDDVKLADFTGCEATIDNEENTIGLVVNFSDVTAIEANHPYIIKVSSIITEFTADGVDIEAEDEPSVDMDEWRTGSGTKKDPYVYHYNSFVGTYVANTTVPNLSLFLSGNQFWYSTGNTKMKAFRAYFDFYDVLTSVENTESRISMNFSDNESTSITSIDQTTNNRYYDLQGRQVDRPGKGVYVRDGRKVVVK